MAETGYFRCFFVCCYSCTHYFVYIFIVCYHDFILDIDNLL